ncbi:hypothetical protein TNCV_2541081 [Trichonephila clavipes]|nr:hypothetical protein TNCV_2541081 [Trichonephila clavipes]
MINRKKSRAMGGVWPCRLLPLVCAIAAKKEGDKIYEDQERKAIAELDDGKFEGTKVPIVHSMMVFKMCEGLGLQAQLAAESDRKIWVAKKKPRPIPKMHSKNILMFCEALNLDTELAY